MAQLAGTLKNAGYKADNVILLAHEVGVEEPRWPRGNPIRQYLRSMLRDRTAADSVVVALACQAVKFQNDSEIYFCPADARLMERQTLLPLSQLYRELKECPAGFKLLLIDACRKDPLIPPVPQGLKLEIPSQPQLLLPPEG